MLMAELPFHGEAGLFMFQVILAVGAQPAGVVVHPAPDHVDVLAAVFFV
jgi:hypothetical protein